MSEERNFSQVELSKIFLVIRRNGERKWSAFPVANGLILMTSPSIAGTASAEPMREDIRRQPDTLARLMERADEITGFAADHLTPQAMGRLHAFGSGDGWFAARVACSGSAALASSGLDFLLNVAPKLGSGDRALAISMSGNVDRTLEAAKAALEQGAGLAILVNGAGGRLKELGVPRLSLDITDIAPFLCGTATYTATAMVLRLIAGGNREKTGALLPALPAFIETADRLCVALATETGRGAPGVRFLGVGSSVASADYGAAKLVEVTTVPAWSADIEEFAHSQFWSMRRDEIVVLLPVDAASAAHANATAEALSHLGTPTLALEPEGAEVPNARCRLSVPGGADTAFLGQALALQLFAYRMGLANGTDPNRRLHLKEDAGRFAVSRRLTRRSLLGTGQ